MDIDITTNKKILNEYSTIEEYVEKFPNWMTFNNYETNTKIPQTALGKIINNSSIPLSKGTIEQINIAKKSIIEREIQHIYEVYFFGYVQGRVFRGTIQEIAGELDETIIINDVENIKEGKYKGAVFAKIKASKNQLDILCSLLKTPHIIAHERTGKDKFDFGRFYIMTYEERNKVLELEPGLIFINMVTDLKIIDEYND